MNMPKRNNENIITEIVHMELDGEIVKSLGKCWIYLESPTKGVTMKDRRPVIKDGDRWLYRVKRVKKLGR